MKNQHLRILSATAILMLSSSVMANSPADAATAAVKEKESLLSKILPFGWGKKKIDPAKMTADEIAALKQQIAEQQKMLTEQQVQQQELLAQIAKQLEPQTLMVELDVDKKANAASNGQGMATVMLYGFANGMNDLPDFAGMAKDDVLIPGRTKSLALPVDKTKTHFVAQFKLRHVKKRAQVVVPLSAIADKQPLTIQVGQCDVSLTSGLIDSPPESVLRYTAPLVTACK